MSIAIRIAQTAAERERIYRFRYGIYVGEMGKQLDYADHEGQLLCDDLDEISTALYAEICGEVVATLRFVQGNIICPSSSWLEKFGLEAFSAFPFNCFSFSSRFMLSPQYRANAVTGDILREAYRIGRNDGIRFDFI